LYDNFFSQALEGH